MIIKKAVEALSVRFAREIPEKIFDLLASTSADGEIPFGIRSYRDEQYYLRVLPLFSIDAWILFRTHPDILTIEVWGSDKWQTGDQVSINHEFVSAFEFIHGSFYRPPNICMLDGKGFKNASQPILELVQQLRTIIVLTLTKLHQKSA